MLKLGVIGYPLKHTMSPLMHNAALESLGINGAYLDLEIEPNKLTEAFEGLKALGFKGFNVTIPYKIKIMEYLDDISNEALTIGAVNTVIIDKTGKTKGDNTDYYGFFNTFSENDKEYLKGKKAVIIGSGGASRAVGAALTNMQLGEMMFFSRNIDNAKNTALKIAESTSKQLIVSAGIIDNIQLENASLIVNTSPVGMYPEIDHCPLPSKLLDDVNPGTIVYDLIYRPIETLLIKEAKKRNLKTYCGTEMLVLQGAKAFELWTGENAPVELMREKLLEAI